MLNSCLILSESCLYANDRLFACIKIWQNQIFFQVIKLSYTVYIISGCLTSTKTSILNTFLFPLKNETTLKIFPQTIDYPNVFCSCIQWFTYIVQTLCFRQELFIFTTRILHFFTVVVLIKYQWDTKHSYFFCASPYSQ